MMLAMRWPESRSRPNAQKQFTVINPTTKNSPLVVLLHKKGSTEADSFETPRQCRKSLDQPAPDMDAVVTATVRTR